MFFWGGNTYSHLVKNVLLVSLDPSGTFCWLGSSLDPNFSLLFCFHRKVFLVFIENYQKCKEPIIIHYFLYKQNCFIPKSKSPFCDLVTIQKVWNAKLQPQIKIKCNQIQHVKTNKRCKATRWYVLYDLYRDTENFLHSISCAIMSRPWCFLKEGGPLLLERNRNGKNGYSIS